MYNLSHKSSLAMKRKIQSLSDKNCKRKAAKFIFSSYVAILVTLLQILRTILAVIFSLSELGAPCGESGTCISFFVFCFYVQMQRDFAVEEEVNECFWRWESLLCDIQRTEVTNVATFKPDEKIKVSDFQLEKKRKRVRAKSLKPILCVVFKNKNRPRNPWMNIC